MTPTRQLAALVGVLTCLVLTLGMWSIEHPFMREGSNGLPTGAYTPFIVCVALALAVLALKPWGRAFGKGFLGALVVTTVLSGGGFTAQWKDPYDYVAMRVRLGNQKQRYNAGEQRWRDSVHAQGLPPLGGADLLLELAFCKEKFGDNPPDWREYVAMDSIISPSGGRTCGDWRGYVDDRPRKLWSWRHTPAGPGSDFALEVFPDTQFHLAGPILSVDSRSMVLVRDSASAKRKSLFSVPDALAKARDCINAQAGMTKKHGRVILMWDLLSRRGPCGAMRMDTVRSSSVADPNVYRDSNAVTFTLPAYSYGATVVTRYVLRYRPNGPSPAAGFDLFANPVRYVLGSKRAFALLQDGSLHATSEDRLATSADPAPLPCELDLRVNCPGQ